RLGQARRLAALDAGGLYAHGPGRAGDRGEGIGRGGSRGIPDAGEGVRGGFRARAGGGDTDGRGMKRMGMAIFPAGAALLLGIAAMAAPAGRQKVLKQIRLPHHYYYREMYLPQATSGAASPVWSPDGKEIALSMEGSLWRLDPATGVARQLTNGP